MDDPKNRIAEYNGKTLEAITLLLQNKLYDHCLILVYSSIDVLGLLDADDNVKRATNKTFKAWTKKYMKLDQLNITEADIYSARCSVLHSHTAQSNTSSEGKAKELVYLYGSKESSRNQNTKEPPRIEDNHQYVFLGDLIESLSSGMLHFMETVNHTNPVLIKRTSSLLRCHQL